MRLPTLLLSVVSAISLVACGGGSSESPSITEKETKIDNGEAGGTTPELYENIFIEAPAASTVNDIDYSVHAAHAIHQFRIAEHLSYLADFTENHIISGEPHPFRPNGELKEYNSNCVKLPENTINHFDSSGNITAFNLEIELSENCSKFGTSLNGVIEVVINSFDRMDNLHLNYSVIFNQLEVAYANTYTSSTMVLSGEIEVDYQLSIDGELLHIESNDLSYASDEITYNLVGWDFSKHFNHQTAKYEISINSEVTSDVLKNNFTVETITPLTGRYLHAPSDGVIEVTGLYNPVKVSAISSAISDSDEFPVDIEFYIESEKKYLKTETQLQWTDFLNLTLYSSLENSTSLFNSRTRTSLPQIYSVEPFQENVMQTYIDKRIGGPGDINVMWEGESFVECKNHLVETTYPEVVNANTSRDGDGESYPFSITVNGSCLIVTPPDNLPLDYFYYFNNTEVDIFEIKYESKN